MVKQITPDDVRKMLQQGGVSFPQTFGSAPKAPSLPKAQPTQQARYKDPMLSPSLPSFDPTRTITPPIRQESTPASGPSWGEVVGTSLKTGATQAALAIPATADALGLEKRNFPFLPDLSWNRETIAKARQEQQDMMSQIDTSSMGGKAKNLGASLIGTLPGMAVDMAMIIGSGGASATSAAPKLVTTAATTASMATQALANIMKSPATANRITRYFAQSYNDSKDQGASSEDAIRNAILYSVPSAIIEASGGIDNVAMDIAKGTNKTTAGAFFKELLLKTAPEEAREEILQDIVGGASRKSTYEPNLPVFSTKEDAVVNPAQIAEAGAMGYAGGVILGGGMRAIQNARLPRFNPETTQQPVQPTPVQPTTEPIAQPPVMQTFRPTPDSLDAIRNRQAVEPMAEPTVETAQPYSAMELPQLENELAKINEKIAQNSFDSDADYRATGQAWQEINALIKEKSQPTTAQAEGVFVDYYPDRRASDVVQSKDYEPITREYGYNPEQPVTIYRGTIEGQTTINNGDWVTTNERLARDYGQNLIVEQVPAKYLYAPKGEGIEELIYSTNDSQPSTAQATTETQSETNLARVTGVPSMTFEQYADSKGINRSQLASGNDMADYIGGSLTETTKAGRGKVNALRKKVEFTQGLQREYENAIKSGEIETTDRMDELNWENKSDQAYARMQIKRAKARGDNEAAARWQEFYDNKFKQPTTADVRTSAEDPDLHIEQRTEEHFKAKDVNAFMYDNPQVKPFYQEMAKHLLFDMENGIKGQRSAVPGVYDGTVFYNTSTGRFQSGPIVAMREYGMDYKAIKRALERIVQDNGKENILGAKRAEAFLDEALSNGYESVFGNIPPNEDYIATKSAINGASENLLYNKDQIEEIQKQKQDGTYEQNKVKASEDPAINTLLGVLKWEGANKLTTTDRAIFAEYASNRLSDPNIADNEATELQQALFSIEFLEDSERLARGQQPTSGNDIDIKVRKEIENLAFEKAAAKLRIETFDGLGLLPPKNIRVKGMLRTDLYQNLQHQFEELVKIYEEQLSKDNSVRKTIIDKYNSLQARDEHARLVEESFAKEDWQVPQSIILERGGRYIDGKDVLLSHKESVAKALSEGEAVPGEVLADYPDLTPQSPATDFAKPLSQEQTPIVDQTPTKEKKSAEKPILNLQRFSGERPEYQALLDNYGRMKEGENPARDVPVPNRTNPNTRVGRTYRTVMEAEATPGALAVDLKEEILRGAADYVPIANAQVLKKVESNLERKGFAESYKEWDSVVRGNTAVGAEQIALGEKLYVEAANQGDYETAKRLVAEIALVARRAGQTVQAMRILKKMTPDGQLYYISKVVDQLNKEHSKKLKGKTIELSKETQDRIMNAKTREELDLAVDQAYEEISPQVPNTLLDKLNAWRYLAMLGNPRTHIRNIVGNALFMPVRGVKNLTGMVIEQAIPKDQRTKAILLPGIDKADTERLRFATKDFDEMAEIISGNGKYNPSDIIRNKKRVFDNPLLEWARTTNFNALEVEDKFTLRLTYNSSLAQFMKARGLTPDTMTQKQLSEARRYATSEAQKATFRDPSKVAKWLSETSKRGTGANLMVEAVMPFKKTPANILKRGIEYSPAGLIKGVYDTLIKVPNGDMTASEAIDSLASGLSGTGLAILGAWLTSLGVITGAGEEEDRLRAFDEMQGTQNYSLRVGDYFYSLDWAAPAAMPFFAGVEFFEALVKGGEKDPLSKAADALTNMMEPAFNMSMLQGINSTIRSAKYSEQNEIAAIGQNAVANYLSQYVPTLSGQIARTIDPVRRNAYYNDKNKNLPQSMQVALNRNIAKLPKANEGLPAYIDQWGREERNDNWQTRAIENFLSPGFVSKTNTTKVDKALRELYDKTGESTLLPSKAPRYISVEGNNIYLTAKQYEKYAKEKGQTSYKYLDNLTSNKEYSKLSDEQKTSLVKKVYEIANAEAKSKVTPYKPSSEVQKIKDAQKQGIGISDYLIIKETADTRGKDENGNYIDKPNNSIDQEEAYRRLEQTNLTAEQKQYLYFNAFNTQWKNLPKIK